MTTKQAIRRVLTNTERFIIGDYNGQKWQCPDAFIATVDDIYSQYKPRKSQVNKINDFKDIANQPKMNSLIELPDYKKETYVTVEHLTKDVLNEGTVYLVAGNKKVLVNKDYYLLMETLYPSAQFEMDTYYSYSPVRVVVKDYINGGNKTVALIMPLRGN